MGYAWAMPLPDTTAPPPVSPPATDASQAIHGNVGSSGASLSLVTEPRRAGKATRARTMRVSAVQHSQLTALRSLSR